MLSHKTNLCDLFIRYQIKKKLYAIKYNFSSDNLFKLFPKINILFLVKKNNIDHLKEFSWSISFHPLDIKYKQTIILNIYEDSKLLFDNFIRDKIININKIKENEYTPIDDSGQSLYNIFDCLLNLSYDFFITIEEIEKIEQIGFENNLFMVRIKYTYVQFERYLSCDYNKFFCFINLKYNKIFYIL